MINDESLENEGPVNPASGAYVDRGPAHAYQLPVRVASRDPTLAANTSSSGNNNLATEAEERLPMRLRGIKAAYGRALGTAGKLCLDKHASTVGGHPESAAQAWEHLTKAAEVARYCDACRNGGVVCFSPTRAFRSHPPPVTVCTHAQNPA